MYKIGRSKWKREEKKMEIQQRKKCLIVKEREKGVTLIVLVGTILVLLILAGISIMMLTGQNRHIETSYKCTDADGNCKRERTNSDSNDKSKFWKWKRYNKKKRIISLKDFTENNQIKTYINGNGYIVHYLNSERVYSIDENGKIKQENISALQIDTTAGILDGNGTEIDPYIIMSIEDLIEWSKNYNKYSSKYIKLGKTLDFKAELSYVDSFRTDYNNFFNRDENITLFEILTKEDVGYGFKPILNFNGVFNGNGLEIKNIYINQEESAGFFAMASGNIENLAISGKVIGSKYIGGIVAKSGKMLKVKNCSNKCNLYDYTEKYGVSIYGMGGILGYSGPTVQSCEIINCKNIGDIYSDNSNSYSGIGGILRNKL